jgi:hypothetical protein
LVHKIQVTLGKIIFEKVHLFQWKNEISQPIGYWLLFCYLFGDGVHVTSNTYVLPHNCEKKDGGSNQHGLKISLWQHFLFGDHSVLWHYGCARRSEIYNYLLKDLEEKY